MSDIRTVELYGEEHALRDTRVDNADGYTIPELIAIIRALDERITALENK